MTIGWVPDLKAIRIIIVQEIETFVEVISIDLLIVLFTK